MISHPDTANRLSTRRTVDKLLNEGDSPVIRQSPSLEKRILKLLAKTFGPDRKNVTNV